MRFVLALALSFLSATGALAQSRAVEDACRFNIDVLSRQEAQFIDNITHLESSAFRSSAADTLITAWTELSRSGNNEDLQEALQRRLDLQHELGRIRGRSRRAEAERVRIRAVLADIDALVSQMFQVFRETQDRWVAAHGATLHTTHDGVWFTHTEAQFDANNHSAALCEGGWILSRLYSSQCVESYYGYPGECGAIVPSSGQRAITRRELGMNHHVFAGDEILRQNFARFLSCTTIDLITGRVGTERGFTQGSSGHSVESYTAALVQPECREFLPEALRSALE